MSMSREQNETGANLAAQLDKVLEGHSVVACEMGLVWVVYNLIAGTAPVSLTTLDQVRDHIERGIEAFADDLREVCQNQYEQAMRQRDLAARLKEGRDS